MGAPGCDLAMVGHDQALLPVLLLAEHAFRADRVRLSPGRDEVPCLRTAGTSRRTGHSCGRAASGRGIPMQNVDALQAATEPSPFDGDPIPLARLSAAEPFPVDELPEGYPVSY